MVKRPSYRVFLLVLVFALAVAGITFWFVFNGATPLPDPRTLPFWECAAEAGLDFQMRFLPNEQGEKFKINLYDHGCGLAVGDYDGDGHEDLYLCNQLGANALFRNRGDGTFANVTAAAGVGLGDRICVAATFADYDNDGRQDLYVTSTRGGNALFHNEGGGRFQDRTKEAGLVHVGHAQTGTFFDADNDGDLDLLLTNTAQWTLERYDATARYYPGKGDDGLGPVLLSTKEHNVFYRNEGNGTFVDVTEQVGLQGRGWAGDAVAFDYDSDGWMDLFVTSMFGRCQLYHNNQDGTFADVTMATLGRTPAGAVGATVFDANNDGRLDLFVVDMHSDMWMGADAAHLSKDMARRSAAKKFKFFNGPMAEGNPVMIEREMDLARQVGFVHDECLFGNAFYRNDGAGRFTEISDQAGLETFWPWSIATGDFNNDGFEDAFVAAGMGYPFYYWPNQLFLNQGNQTFRDHAEALGLEPPARGIHLPDLIGGRPAVRSSRCAVTADLDGDGRLDLVVNNFNDRPYYFKNQLPRQHYVAFRLRGTRSNHDAVGAVVRVYQGERVFTRQVRAACGYLSHSSRTVHVGLGERPDVSRIEITWPSGVRQELTDVAADTTHDVVERAGE